MLKTLCSIDSRFDGLRSILLNKISPIVDLLIRLVLANIFFKSGMLKFNDFWNGNFSSQIFLFKDTYNLPLLPPEIGAYLAMGGELGFSVLFALGFATRLGAAGLLGITALAIYVFPDVFEHFLWALMAATILCRGAGPISLDYLLCCKK